MTHSRFRLPSFSVVTRRTCRATEISSISSSIILRSEFSNLKSKLIIIALDNRLNNVRKNTSNICKEEEHWSQTSYSIFHREELISSSADCFKVLHKIANVIFTVKDLK